MKKIAGLVIIVSLAFGAMSQKSAVKQYSLITDLADTSATTKSIGMLLNQIQVYPEEKVQEHEILSRKSGLVILLTDESKISGYRKLIKKYTLEGGTVFMDLRDFAALNGLNTKIISLKTIKVKEESGITSGYKKDEPIVYNNDGVLRGLVNISGKGDISVLGTER